MDIIGKFVQALLGGERPRTWIDLLIVLAVCGTYAFTQGMRFLHHQRRVKAVMAASPTQLRALGHGDDIKTPQAGAALVLLVLCCAGYFGYGGSGSTQGGNGSGGRVQRGLIVAR